MSILRKHRFILNHCCVLISKCLSTQVSEVPPNPSLSKPDFKENSDSNRSLDDVVPCKKSSILSPDSGKTFDFSSYAPELVPTFNFAAYTNRSPSLQKWIDLGVDMSKLEKKAGIPQYLLGLDFEKDMKNHIQFLHDIGVPADSLGKFLTKNPLIFKEDLDLLGQRIDYLQSILFSPAMISRVVTANPYWLMFSIERIEKRLEFFRAHFSLGAQSCQALVCKEPRLITYNLQHVQAASFSVREEMGFTKEETKRMVLSKPKIWMISNYVLVERFHLAHNEMKVPHDLLSRQPHVLLCRASRTRQRHLFLESRGQAQYDPTQANYISLQSLVSGTDAEFALEVAGTSPLVFTAFLKTL